VGPVFASEWPFAPAVVRERLALLLFAVLAFFALAFAAGRPRFGTGVGWRLDFPAGFFAATDTGRPDDTLRDPD
jgi:hypothetical protein